MAEPKKKEPTGDPEEAARLRAAFAYADYNLTAQADLLGVAPRTVSRYTSGETKPPADAWPKIIAATNVPAWFAAPNFEAEPEAPKLAERVEALEHQLESLRSSMRSDALELLEQALPDLVPGLRQALAEAPSHEAGPGRRGRASAVSGASSRTPRS